MASVRWAFDSAGWAPDRGQWSAASRCVQPEEKQRIGRFQFRRDARASLAGRLMLRRLLCRHTGLAWSVLRLARTDRGKPYLATAGAATPAGTPYSFNVSHQGRFTIVAAGAAAAVGCDVAQVAVRPPGPLFNTMQRQFTAAEWRYIAGPGTERQQLGRFFRCWALKESYVKAEGIGIGFSLQRVSFTCRPAALTPPGCVTYATTMLVDGLPVTRYTFEETRLDDDHVVAVAVRCDDGKATPPPQFQLLTPDQLLDESVYLTAEDEPYCDAYMGRDERP